MTASTHSIAMSVSRESWPTDTATSFKTGHTALYLQSGQLSCNELTFNATSGIYIKQEEQVTAISNVQLIRFSVTDTIHTASYQQPEIFHTPVLSTLFNTTLDSAVMRLDQVDFPAGAIAYRHTHPGAGIRYLTQGTLLIQSDHGQQQIEQGQAWFEDADSPVKATAGSDGASFVRLMLLPTEYEGLPTLNTLDPADAAKPRLQTNTRYFDHRVELVQLG